MSHDGGVWDFREGDAGRSRFNRSAVAGFLSDVKFLKEGHWILFCPGFMGGEGGNCGVVEDCTLLDVVFGSFDKGAIVDPVEFPGVFGSRVVNKDAARVC